MTTTREIEQQLLNLIESSIEDTRVLDAIAAHADKRAGKPVTKTDAEQLEAQLGIPVRIQRRYHMTHVVWAAGREPNPWSDERSILLAHADTGVRWPSSDELKQKEPGYFAVRDERNAARRALLKEHKEHMVATSQLPQSAVTRAAAAIAKIREAQAELEKLTDGPLNVVLYAVEKLAKEGS
jgi:hypothetical protein